MKKLLYSFLALGLLATVACEDDDHKHAPAQAPENSVAYNGKNYTIDRGTIVDWGAGENHYNYDFYLTDGSIDFENETAIGARVLIYAELWSPGTESFSTGTFTFNNTENTSGKRFFDHMAVAMDTNNSGELDAADDQLMVKGGTIKVSGAGTEYALEIDVTLSNDKTLKGKYSSEDFEVFDATSDDENGAFAGRRRTAKFSKLAN